MLKVLYSDKNVLWLNLRNLLNIIKAPISFLLIVKFLSAEEQGLWYTFFSLSAIKILIDLGFGKIIMFAVAHETSSIVINEDETLELSKISNMLSSLIFKSLMFFIGLTILYFTSMQYLGYIFFNGSALLYWQLYSLGTSLSFLGVGIVNIYMGMNFIKSTQKILFISTLIQTFITWLLLVQNTGLLSLGIGYLIAGSFLILILILNKYSFLAMVIIKNNNSYGLIKTLYKFQLKYIASWVSGYAITNIIVLYIYKYIDPILAGKYGLSFSLIASVIKLTDSPIRAYIPRITQYIAKKQFKEATGICIEIVRVKYIFLISLLLVLTVIFGVLYYNNIYTDRILNITSIIFITLSYIAYDFVAMLSTFVRSLLDEPFYIVNIFFAIICITILPLISSYGIGTFLFVRMLSFFIVFVPLSLLIARKTYKSFSI